jgi:RING finger protein 121/175
MHEKHKGHDSMHAKMVLILLVTLILAQVLLVEWKKRYYRSYSFWTLLGLWVVPLVISVKSTWWRFCFFWALFTIITGFIIRLSRRKPIQGTTPRLVYKWFLFIYKLSYALGIIGYVVIMMTFFGFNFVFNQQPNVWMDVGLVFLFYGLYFGVLGRDIAEICAEKLASQVGYYSKGGSMTTRNLDANVCAVCGNKLLVTMNTDDDDEVSVQERTFKLNCGHTFHEFCIRGWCIIGKKQTCPYCKEKVDLKKMFSSPWEKPHVLYGQLLDWIRWLVAWQPLILLFVQGINWAFGLE